MHFSLIKFLSSTEKIGFNLSLTADCEYVSENKFSFFKIKLKKENILNHCQNSDTFERIFKVNIAKLIS